MNYRILDMDTFARKDHFDYFRTLAYPYVGVTVTVDVTALVRECKKNQWSFFLTFLHAAACAANAIPEVAGMNVYAAMDYLAEKAAPGAGGVIFLPYFSGERCPIWDPDAKGAFIGMQLGTDYGDMVRAVLEGVAFSLRQGMELMNIEPGKPIALGGGIANAFPFFYPEMMASLKERFPYQKALGRLDVRPVTGDGVQLIGASLL